MFFGQVGFQDPTGPRTGSSDVNTDAQSQSLLERFREWRPSDGKDRAHEGIPHQGYGFAEQEDLHFMTGLGKRVGMEKRKGGLRRIVGAPGRLYEDLAHTILLSER